MKHIFRHPCKKCLLPAIYLRTVRHFAFSPPEIKFYVLCSCKQDKMYDTAEQAVKAFNKANAPAKKKT